MGMIRGSTFSRKSFAQECRFGSAAAVPRDPTFLSTLMSDLRLGPKSQHRRCSGKDGQMIAVISLLDRPNINS